MNDFFSFKRMIVPVIVSGTFIVGSLVSVVCCWFYWMVPAINGKDNVKIAISLGIMLALPVVLRIICELFVVLFSINETLTDIKELLEEDE